jgi:DNA-binding MarR family transcriptional regulator
MNRKTNKNNYALTQPNNKNGTSTLSLSKAPQVLLTRVVNGMNSKASQRLQKAYDLGVMDFRIMVMLTLEPGTTVARATEVIKIDKGAVSRSLAKLEKKDLASAVASSRDERRKQWSLTKKGQDLHKKLLEESLEFQGQMLEGFSMKEIQSLTNMLIRIDTNIDGIEIS